MESNQTPESTTPEVSTPVAEPTAASTAPVALSSKRANTKTRNTIIAVVVVAMLLVGVFYVMEKQGRIDTNLFGGVSSAFRGGATVATVNDQKITQRQLDVSISQLNQAAVLQGVDPTSPSAQAEIRSQAIDVLVNTELLVQAAQARGINVTDEDVASRISQIETEIGGADVLKTRMKELGIDEKSLHSDVTSEIHIERLLDALFVESDITVTEEEITGVYDAAVASGAEVPALEEVREQIEQQVKTSKEQEVIDEYLRSIKADATIEIVE